MSRHHMLRRAIATIALLCIVGQAGSQEWLRWDQSRPSRDEDPAKIISVQQPVRANAAVKSPAAPVAVQLTTIQVPATTTVAISRAQPAAITAVEPIPEQTSRAGKFDAVNAIPATALAPIAATASTVEPVIAAITVPAPAPAQVAAKTSNIEAGVAVSSPEAPGAVSPVVAIPVLAEPITMAPTAVPALAKPAVSQPPAVEHVAVATEPVFPQKQALAALVVASREQPVGDGVEGFVPANAMPPATLAPVSAAASSLDAAVVTAVIQSAETTTQPLPVSREPSVTILTDDVPAPFPAAFGAGPNVAVPAPTAIDPGRIGNPPGDDAALDQEDIEVEMKRRMLQGH